MEVILRRKQKSNKGLEDVYDTRRVRGLPHMDLI